MISSCALPVQLQDIAPRFCCSVVRASFVSPALRILSSLTIVAPPRVSDCPRCSLHVTQRRAWLKELTQVMWNVSFETKQSQAKGKTEISGYELHLFLPSYPIETENINDEKRHFTEANPKEVSIRHGTALQCAETDAECSASTEHRSRLRKGMSHIICDISAALSEDCVPKSDEGATNLSCVVKTEYHWGPLGGSQTLCLHIGKRIQRACIELLTLWNQTNSPEMKIEFLRAPCIADVLQQVKQCNAVENLTIDYYTGKIPLQPLKRMPGRTTSTDAFARLLTEGHIVVPVWLLVKAEHPLMSESSHAASACPPGGEALLEDNTTRDGQRHMADVLIKTSVLSTQTTCVRFLAVFDSYRKSSQQVVNSTVRVSLDEQFLDEILLLPVGSRSVDAMLTVGRSIRVIKAPSSFAALATILKLFEEKIREVCK